MTIGPSVDPTKYFQINGQVYDLKTKPFALSVANNQEIIPGVSGTIIRVMGYKVQTNGASDTEIGYLTFISGSGNPAILLGLACPPIGTGQFNDLPVIDSGYCSCGLGIGLFGNCAAHAVHGNIFYLQYTP